MHCRASLHEDRPAGTCLAPNIEIGMNAHHDRSDGAACSILGYQVIIIGTQNQPNNKITCTHGTKKLDRSTTKDKNKNYSRRLNCE